MLKFNIFYEILIKKIMLLGQLLMISFCSTLSFAVPISKRLTYLILRIVARCVRVKLELPDLNLILIDYVDVSFSVSMRNKSTTVGLWNHCKICMI